MSNRVGSWVILLLVVVIRQEKNRLRSLTLWCLLSSGKFKSVKRSKTYTALKLKIVVRLSSASWFITAS